MLELHAKTNPTVYHMPGLVQSPERRCVTKLTEILLHRYTRVTLSQCLGFIQSGHKFRENAPHVVILCGNTNPTVYHMSRSVHLPGRSLRKTVNRDSPTYYILPRFVIKSSINHQISETEPNVLLMTDFGTLVCLEQSLSMLCCLLT